MDSAAKTAQAKMHSVPATGTETSTPASSPALTAGLTMAAPKFGTLVPNRIFVGGISANTSEAELAQLFSAYGHVKATKIIADRGGVSKGYGFVTFETEEEAKRLQQESECIVLRERKLNIAPAIKKQPFNRSFDGGTGSPPTVPTSTYYYPNGVGLPYQNGMAFYSAGAPAPGPGIVPPSDPSLYQTAGVFGPQGAASHQTFAPMMYPVPAPSIYMPQQYQYSPMPYEPYYTGTTANAPQFMYATTNNSSNNNSNNSGGNNLGNRNNNTGTTSPQTGIPAPSLSSVPPSLQTHFYTPAATTHPLTGIPAGSHPPQIDHLYYSYTTGPPGHGPIGLAAEQQLLLYTTEISNQPSLSESQINPQDDSQSASSHSEQLQGDSQTAQISSDTTASTPLVPLIPFKYPVSNQYPNYPTFSTVHSSNIHNPQNVISDMNEGNSNNQIDYRTAVVYPAQVYLPQHPRSSPYRTSHNSTSLLPTPISTSQPSYDLNVKVPIKPGVNSQNPYVKGNTKSNPLINSVISPNIFNKTPPNMPNYPYNKYPPVRLSGQQQQQYPKRNFGNVPLIASPSSSYFIPQKSCHLPMNMNNRYFTVNNHNSHNPAFNKVNFSNKNFFPNNSNQRNSNPNQNKNQNSTSPVTSSSSVNEVTSTTNINSEQNAEKSDSTVKSCTPTKITQSQIPFSPTNPAQNLSSPNPQVQFYPTVQSNQRYQSTSSSNVPHHHQQQANQRHRYQANNSSIRKSMNDNNKFSSGSTNNQNNIIRQTKYKMNGMIQSSGKLPEENNLGGAGDASSMNRLPMTPPGTPRNNQTSNDQTQLVNETCHQMQALGL